MDSKLNWGIIGTSFISGIMADAINNDEHSTLCAVSGRTPSILNDFSKQYQVEKTYTNYDELIHDPSVDLVYIALPNHLHHECIIKAAEAGKAILCEKSLSTNMVDTHAALNAVQKNDVFFAEGLMYLCHPLINELLKHIHSGVIGDIKSIQASYIADIAAFVNPNSKGAIYNLGCYPMSLVYLVLTQKLSTTEVMDYQVSAYGKLGADGNICETSASFCFANKINVQIHTAEHYGLKHGFTLLGSKGCITLLTNPWLPTPDNNAFDIEIYEQPTQKIEVTSAGDAFYHQVREIRQAVESNKKILGSPMVSPNHSINIMQLLTDWEKATTV